MYDWGQLAAKAAELASLERTAAESDAQFRAKVAAVSARAFDGGWFHDSGICCAMLCLQLDRERVELEALTTRHIADAREQRRTLTSLMDELAALRLETTRLEQARAALEAEMRHSQVSAAPRCVNAEAVSIQEKVQSVQDQLAEKSRDATAARAEVHPAAWRLAAQDDGGRAGGRCVFV